jgi:hypothetical protein
MKTNEEWVEEFSKTFRGCDQCQYGNGQGSWIIDFIRTLLATLQKEKEEAVAEARIKLLFLSKEVLAEMNNLFSIDIKYADKKQWLEPDEFERIFLHRFNNAGIEALTPPTNQ